MIVRELPVAARRWLERSLAADHPRPARVRVAQRVPWLTWVEAGEDAFEIMTDTAGREVRVRYDIDADSDVVRASGASRPLDVPEGFDAAAWRCDFSDHRDFDGVGMPAHVVATYEFEDEPWGDFRAEVVSVYRESAAS